MQGAELHTASPACIASLRDREGPHTLWSVYLVRRERHQVGAETRKMHRAFSDALCRIDMQPGPAVPRTHRADGRDILNHADLIIDVHEGYQHRVRAQRGGNLAGIQ